MEYARHRAIKKADSDEDEDNATFSMSDIRNVLETLSATLDRVLVEIRTSEGQMSKFLSCKSRSFVLLVYWTKKYAFRYVFRSSELQIGLSHCILSFSDKTMNDVTKIAGTKIDDKMATLKIQMDNLVKSSSDLVATTKKELRVLGKCVSNEHEQRVRLQEQIETLAKQHSKLERAAFHSTSTEQLRKFCTL